MKNIATARLATSNIKDDGKGRITITNVFAGTRDKGLEPNERGWYRLWGGAFNTNNARGDTYPLSAKLKEELTTPNSAFNTRMANGLLGGECNHPNLHLLPNKQAQMMRLNSIDKTRECLQVMSIELDAATYCNPDGSPVTGVWVWVKPTGAYKTAFENALKDPDIQVALSLRTESVNRLRPDLTWERTATKIIGWDWVELNGIPNATKFESYSMESYSGETYQVMIEMDEVEITASDVDELERTTELAGVSMEDAGLVARHLRESFEALAKVSPPPPVESRAFDW